MSNSSEEHKNHVAEHSANRYEKNQDEKVQNDEQNDEI